MRKILTTLCGLIATLILQAQTPDSTRVVSTPDSTVTLPAQTIVIPPLFEYPMAPEELPDIQSRADWLMQNFWQSFDFTQPSVSQAALDHAFNVYVSPLRWATPEIAEKAIDELVKILKKHTPMLFQFTRAAEHNLYADKAEMWVDAAYLKFVDALLADKKINDLRKARYKEQRKLLSNSLIGSKIPSFKFLTPSDKEEQLAFTTPFTVIEFGDPFCSDCAMYKINLETFPEIKQLVADGLLNIYFIVPDGESVEGWQRALAVYPSEWHRGAGQALDEQYDIRQNPSVYLIDANGIIINKYISSEALRSYLVANKPIQ